MADEESPKKIKITVKTPKDKHEIEIDSNAGVKEFKDEVAKKFAAPIEQLCLIFAGKILKDADTLQQHGIKDGLTVHLVIKSASRNPAPAAPSQPSSSTSQGSGGGPDVSQTPFGLGPLGGLAGMGNLGMGSANFMEMQQRMQREMMSNPEMLRQMMDNPFVQQLMSNPEVMRQMITSNPQMRELMERNPEISHMLNNPELMRQTMELARNPAMLQELMRSQDRAMSNLESIPGGFNALQRMYRDVQEPMMDAALGNQNPFASLVGQESSDSQRGRENTEPLPNPWAPSSSQGGSTSSSTSTTNTTSVSSQGSGTPGLGGGMFNSPGMQSLMQQMLQNPQTMENMLQAPYMQAMLQNMSANPEMASQILSSNPMFAGNPQLLQQVQSQMPSMLEQMQNPQMQQLLTNPEALNAIMQIQQGMSTLQRQAPSLFPGLNPGAPGSTSATSSTSQSSSPTTTSSTTTSTTETTTATGTTPTTGTTATATTTNTSTPQNPDQLSNLMSHMMQMMAAGNINQPPEQRYAQQLEHLASMGFMDREANIRALQATMGDVNLAIDRLLQQR